MRGSRVRVRTGVGSVLIALGALVASTTAAGAQPAYDPAKALALLNAQRTSNGLPAGIALRSDWSANCAKHYDYMRETGTMEHHEDPASPYYTREGDEAAGSSVLGGSWNTSLSPSTADPYATNPYEDAPIHLMQLLGPGLSETGIAPACTYTWPGYNRPSPAVPQVLTYPSDGTRGIYWHETAAELPFVPGDKVGLPQGTTTGPHLMIFGWGTGFDLTRRGRGTLDGAALVGPSGRVDVRTVDVRTPGLDGYMPPGGMIIPVRPLSANATYTATGTLTGASGTGGYAAVLPFSFTFTTGKQDPPEQPEPRDPGDPHGRSIPHTSVTLGRAFRVRTNSPGQVSATVTRPSGKVVYHGRVRTGLRLGSRVAGGRVKVCFRQSPTAKFTGTYGCRVTALRFPAPLALRSISRHGRRLTIRASSVGLRFAISVRRCRRSGACGHTIARRTARFGRDSRVRLTLPARAVRQRSVILRVTVARRGDPPTREARWERTVAARTLRPHTR